MSTSRAIKPKRDTQLSNWESVPERAPSVEVADTPLAARIIAMVGLFFFVLGFLAMSVPAFSTRGAAISPAWGFAFGSLGILLLIYHSFVETDFQFRRMYAFTAMGLVVLGILSRLLAFRSGEVITRPIAFTGMQLFFYFGVPALFLGLIFLITVLRNETDTKFRNFLINLVGIAGALMIGAAVAAAVYPLSSFRASEFFTGDGIVLMLLGLLYVCTYIGQQDNHDHAYFAGLALGAAGLVLLIVGVAKSFWPGSTFLVPSGVIIISMSILYISIALGTCVDWPVVVFTRRELAAYFYSPIAYLVLFGEVLFGWVMFFMFVETLVRRQGAFEPIMGGYIINLIPVFLQMFFVPVLTMRLISEETRSGTLEVLLTAPVNEISVVIGKFLACWVFYNMLWIPVWLYMISLRVFNGEPFDYLPILSFSVAMGAISAGFLAMGLFFSSLTSNQIIAAVFAFVGVMAHLALYILKFLPFAEPIVEVLTFVNYLDFMMESLEGTISPRHFVFHLSLAFVFLFGAVKVLESRKWR
jgi:ABC-2 type transport system permease protein